MPQPIDREGNFRVQITDFGISEMESGSVAVNIKAKILEMYEGNEQWSDWTQFDPYEVEGAIWIVKTDGTLNENAVRSLMAHTGWDGNIESIVDGTWKPNLCQVQVKLDTYKDQSRFRIAFINDYSRTPGGMSNVTPEKAKQLAMRFGGQLRALAGNAKRSSSPAPGRPAPPPQNRSKPQAEQPIGTNEEIPF